MKGLTFYASVISFDTYSIVALKMDRKRNPKMLFLLFQIFPVNKKKRVTTFLSRFESFTRQLYEYKCLENCR